MRELNEDWVRAMSAAANNCPYFRLESMQILGLTPGESRLMIDLSEKHLQPFGLVHGGVFASLLDAAGWWAAFTELDEGLGLTTVEMKLNYLAPCRDGVMKGFGRCVKMGRTLGLAEARLEDGGGRLLAHGTVTVMAVPDMPVGGLDSLPSKFR